MSSRYMLPPVSLVSPSLFSQRLSLSPLFLPLSFPSPSSSSPHEVVSTKPFCMKAFRRELSGGVSVVMDGAFVFEKDQRGTGEGGTGGQGKKRGEMWEREK